MTLRVRIPAKINLHLQLLGRRPDGYHELRTLLQSVDLFDELLAERAEDGHLDLEIDPPSAVTAGEDNLVVHAARGLWARIDRRPGARLTLRKRIPVGAGLGGGSADAAATLLMLNQLWAAGLDPVDLHRLATRLGSDVPFFLHGGLALAVGRGDEVYPLPDLGDLGIVLAGSGERIATETVYGRVQQRLTWDDHEANVYAFAAKVEERPRWETMVNDLEPIVLRGWPGVAEVLAELKATEPLRAAVTGSGATVYGVYPNRRAAERAGAAVSPRWWTHVGEVLARNRARPVIAPEEDRP